MILGMTGTHLGTTEHQIHAFLELLEKLDKPILEFHHGDCIGADVEIARLMQNKFPTVTTVAHPPIKTYRRAYHESDVILEPDDYIVRDHNIVICSDVMVGFSAGFKEVIRSGTWTSIRYARKTLTTTYVIYPDGTIE